MLYRNGRTRRTESVNHDYVKLDLNVNHHDHLHVYKFSCASSTAEDVRNLLANHPNNVQRRTVPDADGGESNGGGYQSGTVYCFLMLL